MIGSYNSLFFRWKMKLTQVPDNISILSDMFSLAGDCISQSNLD